MHCVFLTRYFVVLSNVDEVKGKTALLKRDRREGRRGDADKNGGYLSLRTRKLEGAKEEEGKVRYF